MQRDEIIDRIIEIIHVCLPQGNITTGMEEEDLLLHDLNSVAFVSIIVAIEQEFAIEFPTPVLIMKKMNTISKIANKVETLLLK